MEKLLTDFENDLMNLFYVHGLGLDDISAKLNMHPKLVMKHKENALYKLEHPVEFTSKSTSVILKTKKGSSSKIAFFRKR